MHIVDTHEFYEMYRGDKDFRLGMELCKSNNIKFSVLVPDITSPGDRKFFETKKFPRGQIPKIPDNFIIHYLKSRLIFFSKSNLSLGGFFQFSCNYPSMIKKLKPDLIFENPYTNLTPRSYQTYFSAKINGIPVVFIDPGDIPPKGTLKKILNRIEKPIINNAKHIIVYNEMGKERFIKEYGYPENQISVIPKPVDVNKFTPGKGREEARNELNVGERFVVAYLGRLSNNKGARYLLEVAKNIKEQGKSHEYLFLFAGGNIIDSDAKNIHSLKDKYGLDNVHFTGKIPHRDMIKYQAAADLVVYPDVTNLPGFSTVLAESMAMGKAIIIGIKGFEGAIPIIHKETGIIVEARNVNEVVENIIYLKDNSEIREHLGNNVRKYAENNMCWEKQTHRYKKIFERAIEK